MRTLLAFCLAVFSSSVSGTLHFGATRLSRVCEHETNFLSSKYHKLFDETIPQIVEDSFWPVKPIGLGQVSGVTVNLQDQLVVFHRGNHVWDYSSFDLNNNYKKRSEGPISVNTLLTVDSKIGQILNSRGKNRFYLPHGLTADHEGNLWVTDVALHQVFKLPPESDEPTLTLGIAFEPGNDNRHFCKPTDVAVATSGEFFISDGYCNSRVIKYSGDGKVETEWGYNNEGSKDFLVPHSLALAEKENMICVADREHERILCYSAGLDGKMAGELIICPIQSSTIGPVYAIDIRDDVLFAVTGSTKTKQAKGFTIHLQNRSLDRRREHLSAWVIVGEWRPDTQRHLASHIEVYVNMAPKFRFQEGEKVLCFHGPLLYEAKCIKAQAKDKTIKYFIHYSGWNKNWDEWVPESRVLKYNEVNLQKQKELEKAHAYSLKNKKTKVVPNKKKDANNEKERSTTPSSEKQQQKQKGSSTSVTTPATPASAPSTSTQETPVLDAPRKKRSRLDPAVEAEEAFHTRIEIKVKLPEELKPWLVDDWDAITRLKKLMTLPPKMTVEQILNDYVKTKTSSKSNTPNKESAILEVTSGIKEYFNVMLGTQLLYKFERPQYAEILAEHPDIPMSQLYGSIHLLRLFVKLGSMLAYTPLDEKSVQLLLTHIHDFLRYLSKKPALFSDEVYGTAPPEYHRKAI